MLQKEKEICISEANFTKITATGATRRPDDQGVKERILFREKLYCSCSPQHVQEALEECSCTIEQPVHRTHLLCEHSICPGFVKVKLFLNWQAEKRNQGLFIWTNKKN